MLGKKTLIISFIACLGYITNTTAQTDTQTNVINAIANGDAASVGKYFASAIELHIDGNKGIYGKAQAEQILKRFFEKHPAYSHPGHTKYEYLQKHSGKRDNAVYNIGDLCTGNGLFRVYVFIKNGNVNEMRIDTND